MNSWIYSDERMALRAKCIEIMFKNYGGVRIDKAAYSAEDIYNAVHDWVSAGNPTPEGLAQYFEANYIPNPEIEAFANGADFVGK